MNAKPVTGTLHACSAELRGVTCRFSAQLSHPPRAPVGLPRRPSAMVPGLSTPPWPAPRPDPTVANGPSGGGAIVRAFFGGAAAINEHDTPLTGPTMPALMAP